MDFTQEQATELAEKYFSDLKEKSLPYKYYNRCSRKGVTVTIKHKNYTRVIPVQEDIIHQYVNLDFHYKKHMDTYFIQNLRDISRV